MGTILGGLPHFCKVLPPGAPAGYQGEDCRKILLCFQQGKEERNHLEIHSGCPLSINEALPQGKLFNQSLTNVKEREYPTPAPFSLPVHLGGEKKKQETLLKATVTANSKHRLTPTQINIKPHTKDPFISVPITQYIMTRFQQRITRQGKGKKIQSKETKQELEPDSHMVDILELLGRNLK